MKKVIVAVCIATCMFVASFAEARGHSGGNHGTQRGSTTHVNGYIKKNGIVVQSHVRSHSDKTRVNNWSTKGNVNPYTGRVGTKLATKYIGRSGTKPIVRQVIRHK